MSLRLPVTGVLLLMCSACSSGEPSYPTRGQVLVGGKPAAGAVVTLTPRDARATGPKPSGVVGADGWFTVRTYEIATRTVRDGAPPGQYVVTISWAPGPSRDSLRRTAPEPDLLGGRYRESKTSPLRAEVKEGPTELPPFRLGESDSKGRKR
jgi:hypothetical protein